MSRTSVTEFELPGQTRPNRPLLIARRRHVPAPVRGLLGESWHPRELGRRFRASRDPGGSGMRGACVLIADDEAAIRLICRLNLQGAGFDTLEAPDGASALALARAERPDLILLDIMMPELDGWRVAAELATAEDTREIPVVFLSARSEETDEVRAHRIGGVAYITKPFDPIELTDTVRRVLQRARRGERDAMRTEWHRSITPPG